MAQMYIKRVGVCVQGGSVVENVQIWVGGGACVCGQLSIFSTLSRLHTWGSFTFMVIQIMKLSIQGILRWEQWTQLPPAACEMGWQTLRQMGETAVGQRSNHIYLTPLFLSPHSPQPSSARAHIATYQQAKAKALGSVCRTSHLPIAENLQPRGNARSSLYTVHYYLWDNNLTSNTCWYTES